MANSLVLQANQISKSYGHKTILNQINLSLHQGECLVLMGANGAGKTTLTHILQGLLSSDSGTVNILNQDFSRSRAQILANIGVVMQETSLYKRYTVNETLQLFASFYKQRHPDLNQIITSLGLADKQHDYLKNLSGGQKQKLYIATALVHHPKILFLDEPTTGLDPLSRKQIWSMILKLKQQGCAILLTTHYLDEAEHLADRLAILHKGQIIAEGHMTQLIAQLAPQISMTVTYDPPTDDTLTTEWVGALNSHPLISQVIQEGGNQLKISWLPSAQYQDMITVLTDCDIRPHKLTIQQGNLEDVYLNLTGKSLDEDRTL